MDKGAGVSTDQASGAVDKLLGPAELAEWLGIPVPSLYGWHHRGDGPPAMRIGKHLRYRRSDVEKWLAEKARS